MPKWDETHLWKSFAAGAATDAKRTVSAALESAEAILQSGGTANLDFTLHDQHHSYRVAQRMADLLGADTLQSLGRFEIALLLLSAYTHDIGMSPLRKQTRSLSEYIMTGDTSGLSNSDVDDLQSWLDKEWDGLRPPITQGALKKDDLRKAEVVLAYYSRHRHNDWSEAWIRSELASIRPSLYPTWIDDLVTLCRSHHEGLADLRMDRFSPKLAGSPAEVINLRYLAATLRIADVTEFDPERTPDIILRHRAVAPSSKIFWERDHGVAFSLDRSNWKMILSARTQNATIHRATLQTASAVNEELRICSVLEQENAFRSGTIPDASRNLYTWNWPSQLIEDITEQQDKFVYIDGSFRPDTKRILALLSGTELYGNTLAAVRELIQNAVDAAHEQIVRERLASTKPADEAEMAALASLRYVKLHYEFEADRFWLRCSDDGSGMTREIISRHLLVSGSRKPADILSLERAADAHGIELQRSGQFGIGVLSYFMIADRIEIISRRSSEAGDVDGHAWKFVFDMTDEFGELVKASRASKGTEVRLRIRENSDGTPAISYSDLEYYVRHILCRLPCRFELINEVDGSPPWSVQPGWIGGGEAIQSAALNAIAIIPRHHPGGFLSTKRAAQRREEIVLKNNEISRKARAAFRTFGPFDFKFKDPLVSARIRIWLPYYNLENNASIAFIYTADGISTIPDVGDALVFRGGISTSWRGFSVSAGGIGEEDLFYTEVDFFSGGSISVSRAHLHIDFDPLRKFIFNCYQQIARNFLSEQDKSTFNKLNICLLGKRALIDARNYREERLAWKQREGSTVKWKQLNCNSAEIYMPTYRQRSPGLTWQHGLQELKVVERVRLARRSDASLTEVCSGGIVAIECKNSPIVPVIIWPSFSDALSEYFEFPPEWSSLFLIFGFGDRPIINRSHPLSTFASPKGDPPDFLDWHKSIPTVEQMLENVSYLCSSGKSFWEIIFDNARVVFDGFMEELDHRGLDRLMFWTLEDLVNGNKLWDVSKEGVHATVQPWSGADGLISNGSSVLPWPEADRFRVISDEPVAGD